VPTLPPPLQQPPATATPEPLSPEEIARRHAIAARIRALIEKAPTASDSAEVGGLLAEGDAHPIYEDGELRGIGLENVRPDGFYAWLGLRDGDLVQSINGTPLDASGALFQQLIASPQVELRVERSDGSQQSISVTRQQIVEGLQQIE
jgi:type II secretory pathway component PulC